MKNRSFPMAVSVCVFVILRSVSAAAPAESGPRWADAPVVLDHNRMTVEVEFLKDGKIPVAARAWIDTGGTDLVMTESLARSLGVDLAAGPAAGRGEAFATKSPAPPLRLAGIDLDTEGLTVAVQPGRFAIPGVRADCFLPPRCLRRLHVIFDYPARRLVLARPGALTPRGAAVPCRVNPETGLFLIEAVIDGEKTALGVDNGSAGTWVSDKLTAAWLARHPDWPSAVGAAGSTNFFGFPFETRGRLMCLPGMTIGPMVSGEVAVLGLPQELFDWYSKKSAGPVAGFIGADLIARFRLEVDFSAGMSWWQPGPAGGPRDLDIVGLCLRAEADGSYTVAGVVSKNGVSTAPEVRSGDRLLGVDSLEATNAPMGAVIGALRGRPGNVRVLRIERDGRRFEIRATVVRLP